MFLFIFIVISFLFQFHCNVSLLFHAGLRRPIVLHRSHFHSPIASSGISREIPRSHGYLQSDGEPRCWWWWWWCLRQWYCLSKVLITHHNMHGLFCRCTKQSTRRKGLVRLGEEPGISIFVICWDGASFVLRWVDDISLVKLHLKCLLTSNYSLSIKWLITVATNN